MRNLKPHFPIKGTKFVYKDAVTKQHVLVSYSTERGTPEIMMFKCNGVGKVDKWDEVYSERGSHLCPSDIHKAVYRYNSGLHDLFINR